MSHAVSDLLIPPHEIEKLTGYRQASRQVEELRRQGFWRARVNACGMVVLERAHYTAVCAGGDQEPQAPRLRPPKLRIA